MSHPILFSTIPNLISRSPLRRGFTVVLLVLAFFALPRTAPAVTPAPDGGYPNGNTAEGDNALFSGGTGGYDTAIGFNALSSTTSGLENTAVGAYALSSNTDGIDNTAVGSEALAGNGSENTAVGAHALVSHSTGYGNTAIGAEALFNNGTGNCNTVTGYEAFYFGEGSYNTANGFLAMGNSNTTSTASNNTAVGAYALGDTTADYNTAVGEAALPRDSTGHNNTGIGQNALFNNTTGSNNIALGSNAGSNLTAGNNNIDIFARGVAGEANTIRIGKQGTQRQTYIAGIYGATVANGVEIRVDSSGHLGTRTSSARYKRAIRPMGRASEALLQLEPVTFRYKVEVDPDGVPQFGLIAEQVEKVNPDLVVRDEHGKVTTVRYEAVNAMLLNEFLKEHRNVAEQQSTIAELKTTVAQQQKQIEALAASVQKVSGQREPNKPATQLAANNR